MVTKFCSFSRLGDLNAMDGIANAKCSLRSSVVDPDPKDPQLIGMLGPDPDPSTLKYGSGSLLLFLS